MKPIFEDALGTRHTGDVEAILRDFGVDVDPKLYDALHGKLAKDDAVEILLDAKRKLDAAFDATFVNTVSPLVFYVGATGLVPDEFRTKAKSADQIKEKYPDLSFGKDAAEGLFYTIGDGVILSVFTKVEYFSTGKIPAPVDEEDVA
jgi:hypothetical protein